MSPVSFPILTFLLAALSAGGLLFAALQPQLGHAARTKKRLKLAVGERFGAQSRQSGSAGKPRKRSIEDTLKEIEEKQKAAAKSRSRQSLAGRLRQSGLGWSRPTYVATCIAAGLAAYMLLWAGFGLHPLMGAGAGAALGLLLPHLYVGFKRKRRFMAFTQYFPNAVDVIVRGVKSGLPLADCLRVIAAEGQEPVRSEFKIVVDDQTLGVPIQEAVLRLADRVPLPETAFLATVVVIQSQSGGNLTEALGNLSTVLRERKKMRAKIKALSAEAKASAGIIGSLPPVAAGLLYLTSPDYISLLFDTTVGQLVLATCAVWMSIGLLVMRKMINFDF